jgi:tripartite-type tricarboxylate transporter receptor subunit TctC
MSRIIGPGVASWVGILRATGILAHPQAIEVAEKPKDFPNRPITIIVPRPAGGISDVGARITWKSLSGSLFTTENGSL